MKNLSLLTIFALLLSITPPPQMASAAGIGRIIVEQVTPIEGVRGRWEMTTPSIDAPLAGHRAEEDMGPQPAGNYTIFVNPPSGATAHVHIFEDDHEVVHNEHPQGSFELLEGKVIRVRIEHIFTRTGIVSVSSNLKDLRYTIRGPNSWKRRGSTPESYHDVPEGQYSVEFDEIPNCISAPPISDRLVKDSRIDLSINVSCEEIPEEYLEEAGPSITHVTAIVDGENVSFSDLPIDAWYAPWANAVIRGGIMKGDNNRQGRPAGTFRPGSFVSVAELSKIAHKIAGISTDNVRWQPKNERAKNAWFSSYFASAEQKGWFLFQDGRLDPGRNATRAEVVATILQALEAPRIWPKGQLFRDVSVMTPFSSSIETAATDGIVDGYENGNFGPSDPITRAGLAKIIKLSIDTYIQNTAEITGESY